MPSTQLIVITGQVPSIQSQIQAMLADYFSLCSVPTGDVDSLYKLSKLSKAAIVVVNSNAAHYLAHCPLMGKLPTVVILEQPSPELVQQAYQVGADQVLIWPALTTDLQRVLKQCVKKESWFETLKERAPAVFQPVFSLKNLPVLDKNFVKPTSAELPLQVRLFGALSIQQNEANLKPHTQKEQELLGYLLFHYPRSIKREKLCAALWPGIDAESARNRLNVLIYRMRKGEDKYPSIADLVVYEHRSNAYCLNLPESTVVDVHEYLTLLQELKYHSHTEEIGIQICKKIVELHAGEFLEGVERSEWVDRQRHDLREQLQSIILRLVDYFLQRGLPAQALDRSPGPARRPRSCSAGISSF
jgi:DNA-binding response OmpR family regulator